MHTLCICCYKPPKFSHRHAYFSFKVLSDTLMIYHITSYQKYALIDRIDPSKVGVIQIERLKYIPGRNRANNTAALKNRPKHNGTSQLGHNKVVNPTGRSSISQKIIHMILVKIIYKKMIDIIWVKIIWKEKPKCAAYGIQCLCIYSLRSVRIPFMCSVLTNFQLNFSYQLWPSNDDNNGKYSYDK